MANNSLEVEVGESQQDDAVFSQPYQPDPQFHLQQNIIDDPESNIDEPLNEEQLASQLRDSGLIDFEAHPITSPESTAQIRDQVSDSEQTSSNDLPENLEITRSIPIDQCPAPAIAAVIEDHHTTLGEPVLGKYQFPQIIDPVERPKYRERFSRPDVLPPQDTPFHLQVQAYVQRWAVWAAEIKNDDRRSEVLDWISRRMELVWYEWMRQCQSSSTATSKPNEGKQAQSTTSKTRKKDNTDPTKKAVIFSKSYTHSDRYGVKLAELEARGIDMEKIQDKVTKQELDGANKVVDAVINTLDRQVRFEDWLRVCDISPENPLGRDLFMYAIFEIQKSRIEMDKLQSLYQGFRALSQQKNTLHRISVEKHRRDTFMAIVLELYHKEGRGKDLELHAKLQGTAKQINELADATDNSTDAEGPNIRPDTTEPPTKQTDERNSPNSQPIETKSLVIVLKANPGFDPNEFSSLNLQKIGNFQFRYIHNSSLAQRFGMEVRISDYVNGVSGKARMKALHGKYEILANPTDPYRSDVAHGYWVYENRSMPETSRWFFGGLEKPGAVTSSSGRDSPQRRPSVKRDFRSVEGEDSHADDENGSLTRHGQRSRPVSRIMTRKNKKQRVVTDDDE